LSRESAEKKAKRGHFSMFAALRQPSLLALALSYFLVNTSGYGFNIWLPKIVQKLTGTGTMQVSLIVMIPNLCATVAMLIVGWHSDKSNERRWHASLAALTAGVALGLSQLVGAGPAPAIAMLCIAASAILSY